MMEIVVQMGEHWPTIDDSAGGSEFDTRRLPINKLYKEITMSISCESNRNCFDEKEYFGLSTGINFYRCNPLKIRSKLTLEDFIVSLCDLIDMKRHGKPIIEYFGNEDRVKGYSLVQLIETSTIVGHFVDESNKGYIDIFSCKPYDPHAAAKFVKEYFQATDIKYFFEHRE